ncbi:MAG: rhodanese-like domain-containing protein [Dissulfurispiraceae bacterium]
MIEPIRILPEETRKKVLAGTAIFVCAYDDEEKFRNMHLEGAISFNAFKSNVASMPREQEIVFYCA